MILRMMKVYFAFLSLCIICSPLFASSTAHKRIKPHHYKGEIVVNPKTQHVILSLGGGAGFTSDAGESQTFPIVDPITDENYYYDANDNNQTVGLFNAFLGMEWPFYRSFDVQLGVSYYYLGRMTAKGILTQGADMPSSNQYSYSYNINSQQLLVESKWLYVIKRYHPYLLVGLGAAFNRAKNYDVYFPAFTTFSRQYANNNTTAFSYDVGIGLDYDISRFARLGIGYRFTDLGNISLGSAVIDTTPVYGTLSQSHLYTNEILAQLTFFM